MAEYQLTRNGDTVTRHLEDGRVQSIPAVPGDPNYEQFLTWQEAGNTPDPADPLPDPEPTRDELLQEAIDAGKTALAGASTLAEVKAVFAATLDGLGAAITGGGS